MMGSAAVVLLIVLVIALPGAAAAARDGRAPVRFYVSTGGDDGWSGRLAAPNADRTDGPFASITRARDAIRALGAAAREVGAITVSMRGGRYLLGAPIVFQPQDSGAPGAPITYEAYEGEVPVISGGRAITGWVRDGEVWRARVPGVAEGRWYFRQLFVNGRRAQRARSPNQGFFYVKGAISLGEQATFVFQGDDIKAEWARRGDVEVVALQAWAEIRMPIMAVDEVAKVVTLAGKCAPSNREDDPRYWVENAPDLLDAPGEWYLDQGAGEVTYWPRPGEDMTRAEVMAPFLPELVRLEGNAPGSELVTDLHFRGLTFAYTDWTLGAAGYTDMQAAYDIPAVFAANGATSVSLTGCRFEHLGGYAISFGMGCRGNQVRECEITDVGAGGIKIGEPVIRNSERERTGGNHIVGNHIHDIGAVYPAAIGVWVGQSGGNAVTGNHIHDTWYTGMSVGWTWGYGETNARDNLIEFNHVHDIGRGLLCDMGAIYTLGVQPGTVIRGNLFHDITSYGYGGWGIYLDEGSTDILVEDNIVYNTKSGGFHQHYGKENVIRNNVFAFSREAQIVRTRMEEHRSFVFERNIVYWREGPLLGGSWSGGHFLLDSNLYWNAAGSPFDLAGQSLAEWQATGQDVHSVIADPLFADAEHYDFRLQRGSPARGLGIKPIRLQAPAR